MMLRWLSNDPLRGNTDELDFGSREDIYQPENPPSLTLMMYQGLYCCHEEKYGTYLPIERRL